MIQVVKRYFHAGDERGSIEGLINFGTWEEMNHITSVAGCVRGNHYHCETLEAFFILKGRIRVDARRVINGHLAGPSVHFEAGPGDVFTIDINVNHIFHVLEDASWMNFLSKRVCEESPDFHRPKS